MSFGGRDNRDGKRKYQWAAQNSGGKRFQGSSYNPREEYHKSLGSRWERGPKPHEQGFSKSHRSEGNSLGGRDRYNHNRFPHPNNNRNYNQVFDLQPPASTSLLKENEELVGPGSDLERMEKVLATKKRIEEALASKPSTSNNKEIHFQNSSVNIGDRIKDKESHGPNLDLRLTNSDFKEIGSVASAVQTERDPEPTDLTVKASSNNANCTSQQRSFDSATLNSSSNIQASQPKLQKVGGWSMSAVNNIVPETNQSFSPRPRSDMYLQEPREEILGNVSTSALESEMVETPSNSSNGNQYNPDEFSRVGRLYQSFLKSRLHGYTLRVRDKSQKVTGPNPLLDKTVLENHNSNKTVTEDQVIELQMPLPISVKMEDQHTEHTPEHIAAEEANEFCKDFSFLLKDPNFLIPPDDLEKLGLGHLSEMNKLINDRRNGGPSQSSVEDSSTTRNSTEPNSKARNDMDAHVNTSNFSFRNLHSFSQKESTERCNDRDSLLNNGILNYDINPPSGSQNLSLDQTMRPDLRNNESILFTQTPQAAVLQSVSVEAVVEKVVKTILQPSNISSVLNSSNPSTPEPRAKQTNNVNESHIPAEPRANTPLNQMQDVSSKILRLFLIDKQIEELMNEKKKIYNELLSSQEVSQTLFNSWAQDQIQQGNVMNVISNTSNVIPELSRVINQNGQENPLRTSNTQEGPLRTNNTHADSTVEEAISELYSLKKELGNTDIITPQTQESGPSEPSSLLSGSCFSPPTDVALEEKRPKLSVRKDLLDPNLSNISLFKTPNKLSEVTNDINANSSDCMKRDKKKKKNKKKDSVEIINLIEDTDDEDLSSKGSNLGDEVDKKDIGSSKIAYDLDSRTATSMTILKIKKAESQTRVLVVGCKDGFVMGYALGDPTINFTRKIHNDTVTSVFYIHKYLITGSLDSTVCLFSLKEQVETQTLSLKASVQSMDINTQFMQLVVGTKAGSIYSYTIKVNIKVVNDKKKIFVSLHPDKKELAITKSSILAVKLAQEGARRVLIVASRGEQITVRDSTSGLLLRSFDWCDTVFCLELYQETPLVFCGTNTKSVKVVNYTDGENAGDCMVGRSITQITFLLSLMFAASHDGNIYVYDVENKKMLASVIISKGIIQCLAVDSKNNVILVASSRGDLQQIPFPPSVTKHFKKLKNQEKKKHQSIGMTQP